MSDEPSGWVPSRVVRLPPLLSAEDEVELARVMAASRGPSGGHTDAAGEAAREQFILSNLRLVRSMAARYATQHLSPEDLFQEGVVGLMRAVDGFDGTRGYKFSTYAHNWIRKSLIEALERQEHAIRLSTHAFDMKRRIRDAQEEGLSEAEVVARVGVTSELVRSLVAWDRGIDSLDRQVFEDTALGDFVADDMVLDDQVIARVEVERLLATLPQHLRAALAHEYGVDGYPMPARTDARLVRQALLALSEATCVEAGAA